MKLLLLILTLTAYAEAQTVADIARQERERRAQLKNVPVIAAEGARNATPVSTLPAADAKAPAGDAKAPAPDAKTPAGDAKTPAADAKAPAAAPKVPAPAAAPVRDPVKEWTERMDQLRKKVQDLQDQETALRLQVNELTNQFFAPVSDQSSKDQAQARLGETQNRLTGVRAELDQTKKMLDEMQLQGPPKL